MVMVDAITGLANVFVEVAYGRVQKMRPTCAGMQEADGLRVGRDGGKGEDGDGLIVGRGKEGQRWVRDRGPGAFEEVRLEGREGGQRE